VDHLFFIQISFSGGGRAEGMDGMSDGTRRKQIPCKREVEEKEARMGRTE